MANGALFATCTDNDVLETKVLLQTINSDTLKRIGFHKATVQSIFIKDLNYLLETFEKKHSYKFDSFVEIWNDLKFAYIFHGHESMREKKWFIDLILRTCVLALCNKNRSKEQRYGAVYALYSLYQCQYLGLESARLPIVMLYKEMLSLVDVLNMAWMDSTDCSDNQRDGAGEGGMEVVYCIYKMVINDMIVLHAHPTEMHLHARYETFPSGRFEDTYNSKTKQKTESELMAAKKAEKTKKATSFAQKYNLQILAESLKTLDKLSSACPSSEHHQAASNVMKEPFVQQIISIGDKMKDNQLCLEDIERLTKSKTERGLRYETRSGGTSTASDHLFASSSRAQGGTEKQSPTKRRSGDGAAAGMSRLRRKKHRLWGSQVESDVSVDEDDSGDSDYKPPTDND